MKIKNNIEQAEIFVFIASFFLIVIGFNGNSINNQIDQVSKVKQDNQTLKEENAKLQEENKKIKEENTKLKEFTEKMGSAKPIIIDEKSDKFKFESGSAELDPALKKYIKEQVTPQINNVIQNKSIDFIQVIGHTDGQVLGTQYTQGNLDQNLEKVTNNQLSVKELKPNSNTDLALMRALAVVQELQRQGQFQNVKFRAYSGSQLYLPSGEFAPVNRDPDQTRRRIEIRFIPPGQKTEQSEKQ